MKIAIVATACLVAGVAHADDIATRCQRGVALAKKNDLPRAHIYLMGCTDAQLPDDIAPAVSKATREVAKKLRDSNLSSIAILTKPEGVALATEISALPGETFTTPATIWVKAGTYTLQAKTGEHTFKQTVTVGEFSRTSAVIETQLDKKIPAPKAGTVNFDDDGALEQKSGPPPPVKRGSLMSKKYLGQTEGPVGDLADPLAYRAPRYETRRLWLGLRLGGGMFDDSQLDARAGAVVAATLRFTIADRFFYASRFDYSRRTGASIDTIGASIGAGATLLPNIALIAQLRGDVRFIEDEQMEGNMFGASAALNLEVAMPATPMTFGLRFEEGLSEVAANMRERALLLEVGIDWRQ